MHEHGAGDDNWSMAVVWWAMKPQLRRRWGTTAALVLLVGLAGGTVLAAVAGASRTDSAMGRFVAYSRPEDIYVTINGAYGDPSDPAVVAKGLEVRKRVLALPQVASAGRLPFVFMVPSPHWRPARRREPVRRGRRADAPHDRPAARGGRAAARSRPGAGGGRGRRHGGRAPLARRQHDQDVGLLGRAERRGGGRRRGAGARPGRTRLPLRARRHRAGADDGRPTADRRHARRQLQGRGRPLPDTRLPPALRPGPRHRPRGPAGHGGLPHPAAARPG